MKKALEVILLMFFCPLAASDTFCISAEYEKNTLLHTKLIFLAGEQNLDL